MFQLFLTFGLVLATVYSQNQRPAYLFGGHNCGRSGTVRDILARVSGGRNVSEGEYPWMVRLSLSYIDRSSKTCGGFIIDENWVVTAAHCLQRVVSVEVSAGRISYEWGSTDRYEQAMLVPITNIVRHPGFNQFTMQDDIGMVNLPRPLQFNSHVYPICILDENSCEEEPNAETVSVDFCRTHVTSAGWGLERGRQVGIVNDPIDYLKAVDLNIIPRRQCQRVYPFTRILPQFICTSGDLSQVDNQTLTLVKEIPVVP